MEKSENNSEIEKKILGILIHSQSARNQSLKQIKADDFLTAENKVIFQAIFDLATKHQKDFDLLILANFLKKQGQLSSQRIDVYLGEIAETFISDQFLSQYCQNLIENSTIFQIKKKLYEWNKYLSNKKNTSKQILQKISLQVKELSDFYSRNVGMLESLNSVIDQVVANWKGFQDNIQTISCTTGLAALDEKTQGFQKGDLIILAARPSMGKTALALKIAISNSANHESEKNPGDIIIFSLEMSSFQLVQRVLFSYLPQTNLRFLQSEDYQKINTFKRQLGFSNVFVDTSMAIDVHSIVFKLRSWIRQRPIKLVIIDYLQLLKPTASEKFDNRNLEIAYWTRILKEVARELNIPILCLSQLSRYVEKRDDKRPLLSDLRDSGSIEQDADLVLFLYREDYYRRKDAKSEEKKKAEDKSSPSMAEVIIAKHRNGPTGVVKLVFIPSKVTFYDYGE